MRLLHTPCFAKQLLDVVIVLLVINFTEINRNFYYVNSMIALIPSWAHHNEEFWNSINKRNNRFIKLRYGAAAMLFTLMITGVYLFGLKLTQPQIIYISATTLSILVYNIILVRMKKFLLNSALKFNPVHISVIQMVLDLTALFVLVYFTGGVETPLSLLFFFHMVIGSLILPGLIMYIIAGCIIICYTSFTLLEYYAVIPHHGISGFLQNPIYNDPAYIISYDVIFGFVIIMMVVLTNGIAKQLYKMQENLLQSIDRIKETEIEKENYIMGVVHEIKTPISAVESLLDLILQQFIGPVSPQVLEKLKRMKYRTNEAIQMINNILKISRVKLMDEILKEEINLKRILSTVYSKQKDRIRAKSICFTFDDSRKKKRNLIGDSFLLEIAFSNILSNAVKYSADKGKINMLLTEEDDKIFIVIMDDGPGIPKDEQVKIFEQFYRGSNIKHKGFEGVGLGLSVVKQIVERHGGTIKAESPSPIGTESQPGTAFIVSFPLR